jgi:hypothetical protein
MSWLLIIAVDLFISRHKYIIHSSVNNFIIAYRLLLLYFHVLVRNLGQDILAILNPVAQYCVLISEIRLYSFNLLECLLRRTKCIFKCNLG